MAEPRTLATAFDGEIRRTVRMNATQALAFVLATAAAVLLGGTLAWALVCAFLAMLALGAAAAVARRRFLLAIRARALEPGAVIAFALERGILTIWLRSGEAIELRTELVDVGTTRRAGPEERVVLGAHARASALVADLERALARDTLIGELARAPFASWASAWRDRSPFELDPHPIAKLLHELSVQVIAAADYEKAVGQRGMVRDRDVRDIPFVAKVAELQGRLAAELTRTGARSDLDH